MITVRALVQLFVYMNWFSMLFQNEFFRKLFVTILACFATSCPHENNWHVFHKCLIQINLNHKLSTYVMCLIHEFLQCPFLRICMITDRALLQLFVYMNWFCMLFQIDFFRKFLVTILACFVTSFQKCLIQNNLNHKLSTYVTCLIQVFFRFPFLRICMITDRALLQLFVYMNWFSMLFQIDFFRKLLVTILACFVTSCLHVEQNCCCHLVFNKGGLELGGSLL